MEQCKSCEATLAGPYCSQCGQKALTERITLRYIVRSFIEALTNVEEGFWYTMRALLTKPGIVAREYLEGKRKPYYHPVRYLLILITVVTLITLASGVYDLQQNEILHLQNDALGLQPDESTVANQQKIQEEVKKYLNLVALLTLPFVSLVAFWLFRKRAYNYAEHLVMIAFWSAELAVIGLPIQLMFLFFPGIIIYAFPVSILVSSVYYGIGYRQIFDIGYGQAFTRGLLANVLGFFLMFIAIMAVTAIGVAIFVVIFK
ncbi:MAG: DUF3667 domain-containing protein [Lewinellaceae bacterium]|nr:DUF3667 domain-containing protein [Phaeodactylibacter sp.]MCB9035809.1 DUF3667 domain-containing protein [Lewinellaceae bacterium]